MRCRDQVFLDLAVCAEQVGEGGREQRIFADFGDMTPVLCTAVTNLFRNFMSLATDRGERMLNTVVDTLKTFMPESMLSKTVRRPLRL